MICWRSTPGWFENNLPFLSPLCCSVLRRLGTWWITAAAYLPPVSLRPDSTASFGIISKPEWYRPLEKRASGSTVLEWFRCAATEMNRLVSRPLISQKGRRQGQAFVRTSLWLNSSRQETPEAREHSAASSPNLTFIPSIEQSYSPSYNGRFKQSWKRGNHIRNSRLSQGLWRPRAYLTRSQCLRPRSIS